MYEWSLSGIGSYTIANKLNEMKVPTKFNKFEGEIKRIDPYTKEVYHFKKNNVKWRGNVVHDILINPINKGKKKLGEEFYDVPYIVNEEYWDRAIANLKENKKNVGKKVHYNYLLNGIIFCSHCGRQMVGKKRIASGDNSYKCKGKIYPNNLCKDSRAINIFKLETFIIKHLFESKELEKHLLELPVKENDYTKSLIELEEQKTKYIYLDKKLKHQLELLNDPELYDDNIKKEYITTKKLVESQKNLLSDLEDKVAFSKNYSPKENVKKVLSDYVSTLEFAEVKKLIHSIIEWVKLEQSKEEGKMGNFFVNIKYRGFDEISTFLTNWFAVNWYWISRYRSEAYTVEQLEEDRELEIALFEKNGVIMNDDYINKLKRDGFTDEEIDRKNPWSLNYVGSESTSSQQSKITINEGDIINFN